jgi:hypothetical protein
LSHYSTSRHYSIQRATLRLVADSQCIVIRVPIASEFPVENIEKEAVENDDEPDE